MNNVALYTFGLLDPAAGPARMAELGRCCGEIFAASNEAPGFLGRAESVRGREGMHAPGDDFGPWGRYAPTWLSRFRGA